LKRVAMIFYYDKRARYSINPLVASVDVVRGIDVYLVERLDAVFDAIGFLATKYNNNCVLGFSLLTTMLTDDQYLSEIIRLNKLVKDKCITIVGGPHASGDPIGSIVSLGFEYVFIGEAEYSLPRFLEAIREGEDILSVPGIFLRKDDEEFFFTGKGKPIDINEFHPFPYWRYLFNPIEISRGCPYGCRYCQVTYLHGNYMRHRSIERIADYAEIMAKQGLRDIRFISPNALAYGSNSLGTVNYTAIEELLETITTRLKPKYGIRVFYGSFPSEVRPEYIDDEVARLLLKYVANREIIIGAQTGSNRLLNFIGRKHDAEVVLNAVEILHRHGFRASVDFIIGLPSETRSDLEETLNVIKKLAQMNARIHLHTFIPLPGTPFAHAKPGRIPAWFKKEVFKIIGAGKAYGEWLRQEKLAIKVDELRRKGIIMPKASYSSADHQRPASSRIRTL